jgi:hypothetical protein
MSLKKSDVYESVDHGGDGGGSTQVSQMKDKRPYFGMTGTSLNVWVTIACTTGMILFGGCSKYFSWSHILISSRKCLGYDQGVFGGIIVTQDFLDTMGNPDANLQGTIVSLYDIGW